MASLTALCNCSIHATAATEVTSAAAAEALAGAAAAEVTSVDYQRLTSTTRLLKASPTALCSCSGGGSSRPKEQVRCQLA